MLDMLDRPDTAPRRPRPGWRRRSSTASPASAASRRRSAFPGAAAGACAWGWPAPWPPWWRPWRLAGVFSGSDGDSAYGHVSLRGAGAAKAYAKLRVLREGTGVDLSVRGLPRRTRARSTRSGA